MMPSATNASPYPGPGEILDDKYRVERMLGEGGMGAVARATHLLLHRIVAVKFMNPQFMTFPGAVERFLNEGRASGAIKSEHVVPVSDVGCLPSGTPYLVMECLAGLDLADLLARDGPTGLPVSRAVHFVIQILRGLQAAHAIGIIHRDMKPSNCFVVNNDGEEDFVKILDFGISKIAQPGSASLTQTNSALGTPLYMSPEQARSPRDVDARSDLYSVGVILYELLSGHTPFFSESGEFTEILYKLFTADPPPIKEARPDLPDELAAVVHKALVREVPERYATALEMAEALVPFAEPKSLALLERMRAFKPTKDSIMPAEGLPTSLAAFSQLQRGHGTDLMPSRPTTDVQKGQPVTEILIDNAPKLAQKTAVLPQQRLAAQPAQPAMRARPDEALVRTQLDSGPPAANPAKSGSAAQTDLGAARDTTAIEQQPGPRRSPLVYLLPAVALLAMVGGGVVLSQSGKQPAAKTTATSEPPTSAATATPSAPPSAIVTATAIPSATGSSAPSAGFSAPTVASAAPSVTAAPRPTAQKPPPKQPSGPATGFPGLDTSLKQ